MGIDALGRLIRISPEIAEQHQLAVIDCLEVRVSYICYVIIDLKHMFTSFSIVESSGPR